MMFSLGAAMRRKSIQKVEPTLPKPHEPRLPTTEARTIYKQLKTPAEQLKEFRKKQLRTMENLSTDKSLASLQNPQNHFMLQSRYNFDHHNTQSIDELLVGSKISHNLQIKEENALSQKGSQKFGSNTQNYKSSLEDQSIQDKQMQNEEQDQNFNQQENEAQNFDDYIQGDLVKESDEPKKQKLHRKYQNDHLKLTLEPYIAKSESQARMESEYWQKQKMKFRQLQQDQEILEKISEYKQNKHKILQQINKKIQLSQMLENNKATNRIVKNISLPILKQNNKEIVLIQPSSKVIENKFNSKNISDKNKNNKIRVALSHSKLGFGAKKARTICQNEILQEQMTGLQEIKEKLRAKGIIINPNTLRKGLVNMKNEPQYNVIKCFPTSQLPANPIYKKFPL